MRNFKNVVSFFAITVVMVITSVSVANAGWFSKTPEQQIEEIIIDTVMKGAKIIGLNDVIKKSIKVTIINQTINDSLTRKTYSEVTLLSKEWGKYQIAVYTRCVKEDGKMKVADGTVAINSIDYNNDDVKKVYKASGIKFRNVVLGVNSHTVAVYYDPR